MADPGHGLGLRCVEAFHLAAEHRAARDDGDEQARPLHVDAELGAAVHLGRRIEPPYPRPEDLPVLGILEGHVVRQRHRGRLDGEFPVGEPPAARRVQHGPLLGAAFGLVDAPRLPRRGHEHLARRRARLAERRVGRADAGAAARPLHAEHGVDVRLVRGREVDADLRPVGLELLGEQHRQGRRDALTHLGAVHHHEHTLVGIDAQPRVGCEGSHGGGTEPGAPGDMEADDQAGAGDRRGLEELTPSDVGGGSHVTPPAPRDGWRRGSAGRCRSGRCSSSRCRCRRPRGAGSWPAARRRP